MQLIENWDAILKKAWSIKFSVLSAVLGGLEVAVQLVQPAGIPQGAFAGFAAMVSIAATVARVMQQKEMTTTVAEVGNESVKA
jgi:hypothetical protein